jgi:hypothetical protein
MRPARRGREGARLSRREAPQRPRRAYLAEHLHEAPVLLFVAGWKRRGETQHQALFPCIQNVLLACRAVGLGASLTDAARRVPRRDRRLSRPAARAAELRDAADRLAARESTGVRRARPVDECLYWERFLAHELARAAIDRAEAL